MECGVISGSVEGIQNEYSVGNNGFEMNDENE